MTVLAFVGAEALARAARGHPLVNPLLLAIAGVATLLLLTDTS